MTSPAMLSQIFNTEMNFSLLAKRIFDILASLLGILVLLPFLGLVALRIRRESPGPIFFHGLRMGRNGRTFKILKFRTMYEGSRGQPGPCITAQDDCRITPMGRWLRDTKLNELPQLWNVFKGDMSIVGPRPEDVDIARAWPDGVREEILSVRPGITSPASVIYRDEEKLLHAANVMDEYLQTVLPQKLRLDQLYVRNRNFLGDLDVILATLAALLPQLRKSQFSAEVLYNGHLSRLVRRYISWYMIDSVVAFAAISISALLWRIEHPLDLGWVHAGLIAGGMALIFSMVNSLRGLGRLSWHSARPAYAFDIFLSSALTTMLLAAVNWFWIDRPVFPRGMVFVAGLLAFLGFLVVRYRERLLTGLAWRWLSRRDGESMLGERVLIVGAGECGMLAHWLLSHSRLSSLFTLVGMVDDNPSKAGMTVDGLPVLGLTRRIPTLVKDKDIGVILFAIERIHPEEQERILNLCRGTGARLVMVPDLMEMFRERIVSDDVFHPAPAGDPDETRVSGPASALRELAAVRGESPQTG